MKSIIILFLCLLTVLLHAQDTLSVRCDTFSILKPYKYVSLHGTSVQYCDTIIISGKNYFSRMQNHCSDCSNFVMLYKLYRKQVIEGDHETEKIIDGYEQMMKTRDEAYQQLMREYQTLNGLLDSTIGQSDKAMKLTKQTLTSLDQSLEIMYENNMQLKKDLKAAAKAQRRTFWKAGGIGLAAGILTGILIVR